MLVQIRDLRDKVEMPFKKDPELDYRDDQIVWIWLEKNLCVELDRELVKAILEGFNEQEPE